MAISFNAIPSNTREPFVGMEFDSSRAQQGPSLLRYRVLLLGQKTTAGSATADTIVRASNLDQVIALAGRGSMLHRMAIARFAAGNTSELWLGVLADNGAGVAATGTITVTGPATGTGTIPLYFGGVRVLVGVNSGDAATTIATNIGAAVNAALDLPVTATVAGAVVTLAFRHKGTVGNSYDVRHSFRDGDAIPSGVGLAIVAMGSVVAGTTNPSLSSLIAAMTDVWFHVIAHPYTDATSLSAIEAEMASRFGPVRAIDGVAITSASGSFGTLTTLGASRNSPHSSIVAQPGPAPLTPPMEFAAEVAELVARSAAEDPARPFQTLACTHAVAPSENDLWSFEERNMFLYDGIATTIRAAGGVVQISRAITTYQTSPSGADDIAYLDVTTLLTLMYLRYDFKQWFSRYSQHKLANDGVRFGAGQKIMTPLLGKAEALSWFRSKEEIGLVEGFEQFKRDLVVERNLSNPNRLDFLLPYDLVNQLVVIAAQSQFRL